MSRSRLFAVTVALFVWMLPAVMLHAQQETTPTDSTSPPTEVTQQPATQPWIELADGLSYQLVKKGSDSRRAELNDFVTIAYAAFVKGSNKPFAQTAKGKVYRFELGNATVLPGIQKGIVGMQVGELRRLLISPALGFGNKKAIGVPPGSTLVVNVMLTDAKAPVKWEVLENGTGDRKAISGDIVAVNYVGKLEDGTVFDTNDSVTVPFRFGVGTSRVISGFSTGVIGMVVGEKRRVVIPSYFGYGDKARPSIPANSTLIFELQCMTVEDGIVMRTVKEGTGPVIRDEQTGLFAIRIELLTGKVVTDTQFNKPAKLKLKKDLDPAGLYFMARGMRVGEVRQAVLKPELGFGSGKPWFNQALNVTLDLTAIEPAEK